MINGSVINQALARWLFTTAPVPRVHWLLMTLATEASYFVVANLVPSIADWMGLIAATSGECDSLIHSDSYFSILTEEKEKEKE